VKRICAAIGLLIGLLLTLLALRTPCSDPMHDEYDGEPLGV
jgi:hypothetical protein